ncbi:deaminated glutathione amidase, chloroplastic/cytosolic isoform X2 [Syzygium oleosum]|uniref:deaminated glutathione amidase, chloroplastic/cytosolic isoform X2 n=1 Tax=Syzygium oleosum TaxID=219896 RepID=UPI0024B89D2F|nr:deaminated glutathione amidase, chloroplastic/cytosolic isoform X2 [Syzygium oleosum]
MPLALCFNPDTTLLLRPIPSSTHLAISSRHPRSWSPISRAAATVSAMAVGSVRVATAQMTSIDDLAANFATCSRLVQEAASAGAKLLCFPESFSFIGANDEDSVKIAEPLDGPIMQQYRSLARFDVDVPGGRSYKESSYTEPGKDTVALDSPIGRLGLTVCYDVRFAELYQQLRFQHEAQVLLVPAAFTKITGEAHWEILLRARAIETQCYVIAAAQAGKHNDKRESYGDTLIIDPCGTVVGRLPDRVSTGIAIADIDLSLVDSVRTRMPIAKHRKPFNFWRPASLLFPLLCISKLNKVARVNMLRVAESMIPLRPLASETRHSDVS